jgi:DNA primase
VRNQDEIFEMLDLEEWCETESLSFKKSMGSSGMQLHLSECPSCGDRRGRVYLNAETGLGNCFVCNEGFNKAKFIKMTTGLSWVETMRHARDFVKDQGWRPKKTHTTDVSFEDVKLPISFPLPTGKGENLIYLEKRGITGDLCKYFHLRFCVEGWWNFIDEEGFRSGQKFDQRVIIPVFDLDGTLKTFQGRDVTGEAKNKYLFPKLLPGTGKYLYNGQNAQGASRAVLGEGAFDVIAIKKAFDNDVELRDVLPIGSFGKHLSYGSMDGDDQLGRFLQLQQKGLREITIMWDGEHKALIAAIEACEKLKGIGLVCKIALLPQDKDPNEVSPQIVCEAFRHAQVYTRQLGMRWRLRSPYKT